MSLIKTSSSLRSKTDPSGRPLHTSFLLNTKLQKIFLAYDYLFNFVPHYRISTKAICMYIFNENVIQDNVKIKICEINCLISVCKILS